MLYGLDSAYPPTQAQAESWFSAGWTFYGGYLGGPRAVHAWTNADFGRLAQVGFRFIPIYVGRTHPWDKPNAFSYKQGLTDGDQANNLMGQCGFNEVQPVCLDAEYGDYQNEPKQFKEYVRGFSERVNAAGHPLILYSDMVTLAQFDSSLVDAKWGADYVDMSTSDQPPVGQYDPSQPPPWDMWQFGDHICAGACDGSSARDDYPFAEYTPPA